MNLHVHRYNFKGEFTQGLLLLNGLFQCYTLEDEQREVKVWGETCIPAGKYQVKLRTEGRMHEQYKTKFPDFHKGMLHIVNVPGFEYILIHIGNTDKDTAGCLLVGNDVEATSLEESTKAYEALYKSVVAELLAGREVWITYSNLAA